MPRAIWTGAISFGLVNVPVRLFSAVSQKEVRFHMLHGKDGGRVRLKRVCSIDGEEVPYDEIVKGYELSKGQHVVIEPDELARLDPKASRTIEIEDFVDIDHIDPIFFERTYYTAPDRGAAKAYSLLLDAMRSTGKVAIARMVMRTKGYLCCVRPMGEALALSTMLYADEVVPQADVAPLDIESARPRERELDMAVQLVESLATDFVPEKYRDVHRDRVLELIEEKAAGRELVSQPAAEPETVVNLADALARSLAAAREREAGEERAGEGEGRVRAPAPSRAAARTVVESERSADEDGEEASSGKRSSPTKARKTGTSRVSKTSKTATKGSTKSSSNPSASAPSRSATSKSATSKPATSKSAKSKSATSQSAKSKSPKSKSSDRSDSSASSTSRTSASSEKQGKGRGSKSSNSASSRRKGS